MIGAGNRAQDNAITRPMSSALLNRMFHVELRADSRIWLEWAAGHGIHPYVWAELPVQVMASDFWRNKPLKF